MLLRVERWRSEGSLAHLLLLLAQRHALLLHPRVEGLITGGRAEILLECLASRIEMRRLFSSRWVGAGTLIRLRLRLRSCRKHTLRVHLLVQVRRRSVGHVDRLFIVPLLLHVAHHVWHAGRSVVLVIFVRLLRLLLHLERVVGKLSSKSLAKHCVLIL